MPCFTIPGPVQPAKDLNSAKEDLARFGYCVLPDAISTEQVQALRQRIEEQIEAERRRGLGYTYGGDVATRSRTDGLDPTQGDERIPASNRWVTMLVNKGQVFLDLLEHCDVDQLLGEFLGEDYLLSSYAVHITRPGIPARPVCHTDQWWMPRPYARNTPHRPVGNVRREDL